MKIKIQYLKSFQKKIKRFILSGLPLVLFFTLFLGNGFSQEGSTPLLKKKVQQSPEEIQTYFNQGREFEINGKLLEAERTFKEILRLNPKFHKAYIQLGMLYQKQKRFGDAVVEFKKALEIEPSSIAHKNLGIAFTKLGKNRKAVKEFEAVIEMNPNSEDIHFLLGKVLFNNKLDNHQRVIEEFKKALKANPQRWEASFALGLVYKSQKLFKDAISHFSKVVAIRPSFADAHYQLGHMYIAIKDGKAAITHLLKAEELYIRNKNKQKVEQTKKYLKKLFKKYNYKRSDFS